MKQDEIGPFLRQPRIADLATVRPDGSPHVAPVWYHYDGETVRVIAEASAVKLRNIEHDPRVALSIATGGAPYQYALVNGTAEVSHETPSELLRTMAISYMGRAKGERYADRVLKEMDFRLITVTPSRIVGWASEE